MSDEATSPSAASPSHIPDPGPVEPDDPAGDPDSTVGTGSAVAIGCAIAAILVIFLGLLFLILILPRLQ